MSILRRILEAKLADSDNEEDYGPPIPMPEELVQEQHRHQQAVTVLDAEHEAVHAAMEAEVARWRANTVRILKCNETFMLNNDNNTYRIKKSEPKKGEWVPSQQPPAWVRELLEEFKEEDPPGDST